ncbi:MAG: ATP synthase F0 subunit C [Fimbriimonadaceae bacterium]
MIGMINALGAIGDNFGLGIGIAALGAAIGVGLIGYSAMQGMSRQPEAIGKIQVAMLIAFVFVELVFLLTVFIVPGSIK